MDAAHAKGRAEGRVSGRRVLPGTEGLHDYMVSQAEMASA